MKRRIFVKTAGLATAGLALSEITAVAAWQPGSKQTSKVERF
jgi:hypothetical protein